MPTAEEVAEILAQQGLGDLDPYGGAVTGPPGGLAEQSTYTTYNPWARVAPHTRFSVKPLAGRQGDPDRIQDIATVPFRAAAGFTKAAIDRAAEEHGGATQLSTDYDPRRVAAYGAAEVATDVVGTPGGVPAAAVGSAMRDPRLWSPISREKLRKPLAEMEHRYTDVRHPVPRFVDPTDLVGGHLILTPSDLSRTNRTVTHIDTRKLDRPVTASGGVGFPEANPGMGWASEQAIARRLDNEAAELAKTGKPVYIGPMAMSPQGIDASHHVADPLAQLVQHSPIKRKDATAFNEMMQGYVDATRGKASKAEKPDWVSINSERFPEYIRNLEGGMSLKREMAKRMAQEQWQSKGFPDVAAVRHAMTEPALIDVPRNTFGMAISQYIPGKGLLETTHPSYSKGVAGQAMGQLASLVPFETGAPSIAKELAKLNAKNLAAGKKVEIQPAYHLGRPSPGVPTSQYLDQEWLEGIMKRMEADKR